MDSFDLDLDSGVLTLRFSKDVNAATFDPTTISFTDDNVVVHSFYELTGGMSTAVDSSTLSVTLTQSDISSLIAVPSLCLNTFTCHMAYTLWLVEASNGDPTLPGVLRVTNFVPCELARAEIGHCLQGMDTLQPAAHLASSVCSVSLQHHLTTCVLFVSLSLTALWTEKRSFLYLGGGAQNGHAHMYEDC